MSILSVKKFLRNFNSIYARSPVRKEEFHSFVEYLHAYYNTVISELDENPNVNEDRLQSITSHFLKDSLYRKHDINPNKRQDLAIKSNNTVNVILEFKAPKNTGEMINGSDISRKALHEALHYYFEERLSGNVEIKNIIISNCLDWYVFDASEFEKLYKNKKLHDTYKNWQGGFTAINKTSAVYDFFKEHITNNSISFNYTNFNLELLLKSLSNKSIQEVLDNLENHAKKAQLLDLYRLLHPECLLREYNPKDSNELNKGFYDELLYIMGLEEKEVDKKPKIVVSGLEGSLIKEVMRILKTEQGVFDDKKSEDKALELVITWINRVLFLKLFEGQLTAFNDGKNDFEFITTRQIKDFDSLNTLFFSVLGVKENEREDRYKKTFSDIPYLNSSLFEVSSIEKEYFRISSLRDDLIIKIKSRTALKRDYRNKKQHSTLEYLLDFLDSYDFSNESSQLELIENSKDIINASVLGLIFEKINGYKDGSFYTPGFITEYMSKEVIEKAVLQKFNDAYGWDTENLTELSNLTGKDSYKAEKLNEYNNLVNSITVCDPAVGSGHFLVSVLNELIAVKSSLDILADENGKKVNGYSVSVENDILIVYNLAGDEGQLHYKRNDESTHKIQQVIFKEKVAIIENCVFGVDINPNSVNICRLRLWIELLKHTYYKTDNTMAILPNIDINIKCGDSLISKYLPKLGKSMHTGKGIQEYKDLVKEYKSTSSKEVKSKVDAKIHKIKYDIAQAGQLDLLDAKVNKKVDLESLYKNSLEWLIEFPEVLDEKGKFVGFDVIIGNPPYIQLQKNGGVLADMYDTKITGFTTFKRSGDIYCLFYEQAVKLLAKNGVVSFITSNKWMRAGYGENLRSFLTSSITPTNLIDLGADIFDSATVDTNILTFQKGKIKCNIVAINIQKNQRKNIVVSLKKYINLNAIDMIQPKNGAIWALMTQEQYDVKAKLVKLGKPLNEWDVAINYGIKTGFNDAFIIDTTTKEQLCQEDPSSEKLIKPLLRGKDIVHYGSEWDGLWLITTFPALKINIDEYPSIKNHLEGFGKKIHQTGEKYIDEHGEKQKSRKKTFNKWFETQDQIAYSENFEKQKIIYPNMTSKFPFMYDSESYYTNQKCFIITGNEKLKYFVALFNSNLGKFWIKLSTPELGNTRRELSKIFFDKFPIAKITKKNETQVKRLEELAMQITEAKKQTHVELDDNSPTVTSMENEIDHIVYELYKLTPEEVEIIERT